jgi:hypothetical protein
MKRPIARLSAFAGFVLLGAALASPVAAQAQQPPKVQMPQPGNIGSIRPVSARLPLARLT